jgi:hypothetical protein
VPSDAAGSRRVAEAFARFEGSLLVGGSSNVLISTTAGALVAVNLRR